MVAILSPPQYVKGATLFRSVMSTYHIFDRVPWSIASTTWWQHREKSYIATMFQSPKSCPSVRLNVINHPYNNFNEIIKMYRYFCFITSILNANDKSDNLIPLLHIELLRQPHCCAKHLITYTIVPTMQQTMQNQLDLLHVPCVPTVYQLAH